jgi:hypothetical protein
VLAGLAGDAEKLLRAAESRPPAALCDALSNLMVGFVEPPEAAIGPVPAAVEAALKGKSVALVGLAGEDAARLFGALERASAKPRLFEAGERPAADAIASCSLVVVHVGPATLGTTGFIRSRWRSLKQPLVLIGMRGQLLDLDPSVLPRAADLLIDGWQPEEALIRLGHALSRAALVRFRPPPRPKSGKPNFGICPCPARSIAKPRFCSPTTT